MSRQESREGPLNSAFLQIQLPPHFPEEGHAEDDTHDLSDDKAPPDIVYIAGQRQQPCGGQQDDQLPADGYDQGVDAS